MKVWRIFLFSGFLFLLAAALPAAAQHEEPPPPAMPDMTDRLAPPPTVYPPAQADSGAQVYYQVCMVCHGDRGQGLTDEWRGVLDPEDQNCWQSRCHATNHPPDGFIFPKYVPPVVGPVMKARFNTALDLHDFLKSRMPWQAPGTRSEEEYWQLTAFLLRLNGFDPGPQPLDEQNAAAFRLVPATATPPPAGLPGALAWPAAFLPWAAGLLVFGSLLFLLVKYQRR